jgi:hypothetical protein
VVDDLGTSEHTSVTTRCPCPVFNEDNRGRCDMGAAERRVQLVSDLNRIFGAANIASTAARLQGLSRRADFLTMTRAAGALGDMNDRTFRRFRQNLPIPTVIQQVLTAVHRQALFGSQPIPMHFEINDALPPSISVAVTNEAISIRLDRPDPLPRKG